MNFKKAFSLFEILLVVFLSSLVLVYTFVFTKELYFKQQINQELAVLKIDLSATRIILEKNAKNLQSKLSYSNNTLYLNGSILLKDISSFSITKSSNIYTIDINLKNSIKKTWKIKEL